MEDLKVFVNFKQGLSDFMVELQKTPSNVLRSFGHLIELKNPHFIIKQVLSQYTPVQIVSNSEFLPDIVNLFLSVCDPQAFVTLKSLVTSCKEPKYDSFSSALNEYLNRKLVFDEKVLQNYLHDIFTTVELPEIPEIFKLFGFELDFENEIWRSNLKLTVDLSKCLTRPEEIVDEDLRKIIASTIAGLRILHENTPFFKDLKVVSDLYREPHTFAALVFYIAPYESTLITPLLFPFVS